MKDSSVSSMPFLDLDISRSLLDLIDELRGIGVEQYYPIPQIAVMGDQSSGKSSVLEAICGVPFPRGKGLVTKCATLITMKQLPLGSKWSAVISVSSINHFHYLHGK